MADRAIHEASAKAGLGERTTSHLFRHSHARHLLEVGQDIRMVQARLAHPHMSTTIIYTRVLNQGGRGVGSPLDRQGTGGRETRVPGAFPGIGKRERTRRELVAGPEGAES